MDGELRNIRGGSRWRRRSAAKEKKEKRRGKEREERSVKERVSVKACHDARGAAGVNENFHFIHEKTKEF